MSGDCMSYHETIDEFLEAYSFKDSKKLYTDGLDVIPMGRLIQCIEHYRVEKDVDVSDCDDVSYTINIILKENSFEDEKQAYTNGSILISLDAAKQIIEQYTNTKKEI